MRSGRKQDTDVEREVRVRRSSRHVEHVGAWRWALVLLVGLTLGVLSLLINLAASSLTMLRFRLTTTLIQKTGKAAGPRWTLGTQSHCMPEHLQSPCV